MARRPSPRHARPSGRGALETAYSGLVSELAAVRSERHADQLELTRLSALVEGLAAEVTRLSRELADVRRELQAARTSPPRRDPYVELLAAQAADLRAVVAAQQAALADLGGRLVALLERVVPVSAAPEPMQAAREAPEVAVATAPGPPGSGSPVERPSVDPDDVPEAVDGQAREILQIDARDAALDDATLMRLRLIRQSFDA